MTPEDAKGDTFEFEVVNNNPIRLDSMPLNASVSDEV